MEEARKRYAQAVQLDSQSYLAHYYYAADLHEPIRRPRTTHRWKAACATAIRLNPTFDPAYDRLAVFSARATAISTKPT